MIQSQKRATRFIQRVIYTLKRLYGFTLTLHKVSSEDLDRKTGQRTATIQICKIKRAIILPSVLQTKFEHDLIQNNFAYGGLYDSSLRKVIIDARDLGDFEIEMDDYFIFEEKRWDVSKIDAFEFDTAFLIVGKEVKGTPRYLIQEIALEDNFQLAETIVQQ